MRFPEFTEPWERKSLGDIGETIIGLTYKPTDVVKEGGVIVLRSSNIQNGFIDYKDIVRVDKKIKDNILTREHDLLVCARNGSPRLIGKNAILSKADANQTFGAFMMVFRSPYNHFVHHLLATKRYISQVSENLGARINQITSSDLNSFEFFFPNSLEMEKIAELIDLLDRRIAVQSKLIEDLQQLKSALVERLYCQHNPNFKIGDLVVQVSKRNRGDNDYSVLSVNNRLGFIEQSEQFEDRSVASEDTSNYKVVSRDDFAYNPARINVGSIARLTSFESGIVSPMYICFHTKKQILPQYLEHFFDTRYFYYEMQKRLEGSVRLCLSWEGLCNIPIAVPPIERQEKVSKRISRLADKISLEKLHLDLLKSQKRYLLQAMFI